MVGGDLVDDAAAVGGLGEIVTDGRPERLVLIDIEGVDRNCPQYITPCWSELADALAPLRTRLHEQEQENARLRAGVVQR